MAFARVLISEAVKRELTMEEHSTKYCKQCFLHHRKLTGNVEASGGKTEKFVLWVITMKESPIQTKCPNPITQYVSRAASCRQSTVFNGLIAIGRS